MVTGNEEVNAVDTDTFEELNWGVFLKNGNPTPTLLGAAKGKTKAKNFVTSYLGANPSIDKATIIARPLGKSVQVRTKEVHTF